MLVTYMDNISFISTAEHWGKAIDARSLSLRGDFYFLSEDTVLEMAESVLGWLSKTLSHGFVVKCYMQEKSIAKNRAILNFKSELQTKHYIFYKEEAFAISPVVYNINTFLKCLCIIVNTIGKNLFVISNFYKFHIMSPRL